MRSDNTNTTNHSTTTMYICAACHAPAVGDPGPPPRLIVFTCCDEALCSRCIAPAITTSVAENLWANPGKDSWVRCPIMNCRGYLAVATADRLMSLYINVGAISDALRHVEMFARVVALRKRLSEVTPGPGLGRIQGHVAKILHQRLQSVGAMADVLSDRRPVDEIEVDSVSILPVAGLTHIVHVPIITSLLRLKAETRTCTVCADDLREVDVPSRALWERATERFYRADLNRFLDPFPTADDLPSCASAHVLDVCKMCISRHVAAKLEVLGVAGVAELQCPSDGCGLIYTPQDTQVVADQATFDKYQRLYLTKTLADEPTFRWCLNPGCGAGAFYDTSHGCCDPAARTNVSVSAEVFRALGPEARAPERIVCDSCNYPMCFAHGTPWHRGLSCAEFTALEARGDSSSNDSWIARNTKKCPGPNCGVAVEKGNGCFHMTCARCRFEFCWECLAPWGDIFPRGGYRFEGHRVGCFFRSGEAPRPMILAGETVGDAVGAMEVNAVRMRGMGRRG